MITQELIDVSNKFANEIAKIVGISKIEQYIDRKPSIFIRNNNYGSPSAFMFSLCGSPERMPIYCALIGNKSGIIVRPDFPIIVCDRILRPSQAPFSNKSTKFELVAMEIANFIDFYCDYETKNKQFFYKH